MEHSYLVVEMTAVESVIMRLTRSPTDSSTVRLGILLAVKVSILANAVNHKVKFI